MTTLVSKVILPKVQKRTFQMAQSKKKHKHSVNFSDGTEQMFEEIKHITDVDSETEVLRNAVRIHHNLLMAQKRNAKVILEEEDGIKTILPIDFFTRIL